jgi:diadenosine tetraphosphate (Ap4A) HIT family hydrolase
VTDECPICLKHRGEGPLVGERIYEDAHVLGWHAPPHAVGGYLGYLFVEPRRHVPGLDGLSEDEAAATGVAVTRLARALRAEGAEHVYAAVLGHNIPHLHVHVVARWPGTPRQYRGTHVDEWPGAPRGGESEVTDLAGRLRARLAEESGI